MTKKFLLFPKKNWIPFSIDLRDAKDKDRMFFKTGMNQTNHFILYPIFPGILLLDYINSMIAAIPLSIKGFQTDFDVGIPHIIPNNRGTYWNF
jgi:hypothetical protein